MKASILGKELDIVVSESDEIYFNYPTVDEGNAPIRPDSPDKSELRLTFN